MDSYISALAQRDPVRATELGIHEHDARLPELTFQASNAHALDDAARLAALSGSGIDDEIVRAALRRSVSEHRQRLLERNPLLYVETAVRSIHALLLRPPAGWSLAAPGRQGRLPHYGAEAAAAGDGQGRLPPEAGARLRGIPALLEPAYAQLQPTEVPLVWRDMAVQACHGASGLLASVADSDAAVAALDRYREFLERLQPGGSFACGAEHFDVLLHDWHFMPESRDELFAWGQDLANRSTFRPGAQFAHPPAGQIEATYRAEIERARAFVDERQLVDGSGVGQMVVRTTPEFLRSSMPLGFVSPPPPFGDTDEGILFITPADTDDQLRTHSYPFIRAIALHESYPGHHLQLSKARHVQSDVRRWFASTVFVEGWGLYCEALMGEQGYYDASELLAFQQKNALWRAVRIMIDVSLHTRGMSVDQAVSLLVNRVGFEPAVALGEVRRYTLSPMQPSSYALGQRAILGLRDRFNGSLRQFHDWLLSFGSIPPALIERELP